MANIEIVQIFVSFFGSLFNIWSLWDAYRNAQFIHEARDRRKTVLRASIFANTMRVRRELIRLAINLVLVVGALIALSLRGNDPGVYPSIIFSNKVIFMTISCLSALQSIWEKLDADVLVRGMVDENDRWLDHGAPPHHGPAADAERGRPDSDLSDGL